MWPPLAAITAFNRSGMLSIQFQIFSRNVTWRNQHFRTVKIISWWVLMVLVATWRFRILQMFSIGLRFSKCPGQEVYECFVLEKFGANFCSVARSTILHENTSLWLAKTVSHLKKDAAFKNFHKLLFVHHPFNNRKYSWTMIADDTTIS